MSRCLLILMVLLIHQTGTSSLAEMGIRRTLSPEAVIQVPGNSPHSVLGEVLGIGVKNHLPIGFVLGNSENSDVCRISLNIQPGSATVAELIASVDEAIPEYRADLKNGVLEIAPSQLSAGTSQLLNMNLVHFQADSGTHQSLGLALWSSIRAIVDPSSGTNVVHPLSLSAETVTGLNVRNVSVESVLARIVTKGKGGVWILDASKVKELLPETRMPYEIYAYSGDDQTLTSNTMCPH